MRIDVAYNSLGVGHVLNLAYVEILLYYNIYIYIVFVI